MTIHLLLKIAAVGIIVNILNQLLKNSGKDEHAYLVSLCGFLLVLTWVLPYVLEFFREMEQIFAM